MLLFRSNVRDRRRDHIRARSKMGFSIKLSFPSGRVLDVGRFFIDHARARDSNPIFYFATCFLRDAAKNVEGSFNQCAVASPRVRAIMVSERHSLLHLITCGKKQPDEIQLALREASSKLPRDAARIRVGIAYAHRDRRSITHRITIRRLDEPFPMKRGVRARAEIILWRRASQ